MPFARTTERDGVTYCGNEYEPADGADALVIATEWNQFRGLDLERVKAALREPVLVDLRNVYEPAVVRAKGFRYHAVGR
jgi:UDPglucose 6-dehydrogenase